MDDVFAGYSKLRPGRIHLYCPGCGQKMSNAHRSVENDPPNAHLMHVSCEKCSQGCKCEGGEYMDSEGRWLDAVGWASKYWDKKEKGPALTW